MTVGIREILAANVAAILTLVVAGPVLHWPPFAQFLAAMTTLTVVGILQLPPPRSKAFARTRRGWAAALNFLAIFAAVNATWIVERFRPDDWPALAIGVILPLFLLCQVAIDHFFPVAKPSGP